MCSFCNKELQSRVAILIATYDSTSLWFMNQATNHDLFKGNSVGNNVFH